MSLALSAHPMPRVSAWFAGAMWWLKNVVLCGWLVGRRPEGPFTTKSQCPWHQAAVAEPGLRPM